MLTLISKKVKIILFTHFTLFTALFLKSLLFVASNAMNISFHTYTRVVELIKQGKTLSKFIPHETQLGQTIGRGHQALC
jgi:hypothetical protein